MKISTIYTILLISCCCLFFIFSHATASTFDQLVQDFQRERVDEISTLPRITYDQYIKIKVPPNGKLNDKQQAHLEFKLRQLQFELEEWGNMERKTFYTISRSLLIIPDFIPETLHRLFHYTRIAHLKKEALEDEENNSWLTLEFPQEETEMREFVYNILKFFQKWDTEVSKDFGRIVDKINKSLYSFISMLFKDTFIWEFILETVEWLYDLVNSHSANEFKEKFHRASDIIRFAPNIFINPDILRSHPFGRFLITAIPGFETLVDINYYHNIKQDNNWLIKINDLKILRNSLLKLLNNLFDLLYSYIFPIIDMTNIEQYLLPFINNIRLPKRSDFDQFKQVIKLVELLSNDLFTLADIANITHVGTRFELIEGDILNTIYNSPNDILFLTTYYNMIQNAIKLGKICNTIYNNGNVSNDDDSNMLKLPPLDEFILIVRLSRPMLFNNKNNKIIKK